MTEAQSSPRAAFPFLKISREILANRWLYGLFIVFAILAAFNLALAPAYISTQKAREEMAIADNAALLQQAQAAVVEQQAITQTELAKNAERKQKSDAKKAKAEALKAKAEQEIAAQTARNAAIMARAEADDQTTQAEIEKQTLVIKKEVARQAFRIKTAEAIHAEMEAAATQAGYIAQHHVITGADLRGFLNNSLRGTNQPPGARLEIPQPPEKFDFEDPAEKQTAAANIATPEKPTLAAPEQPHELTSPQSNFGTATVKTFRVTSDFPDGKLSLRDGPGKQHSKLSEIPAGAILRQLAPCVNSDDGVTKFPWCKVDWNGTTGWVSSSGLQAVD